MNSGQSVSEQRPTMRSNDRGEMESLCAELNAELKRVGKSLRWEVTEDRLGTPWTWTLTPVRRQTP